MIRAWKVFSVRDGKLAATVADYVFDGPVARGCKPFSRMLHDEIHADPVGAVRKYGDAFVIRHCRDPEDDGAYAKVGAGVVWYIQAAGWGWPGGYEPPKPVAHKGYHAFKTREQAEASGYTNVACIAEVDLFGMVVEHERGYRAEGFRFARLIIPDNHAAHKAALETLYDCEVEIWPTSAKKSASTKSTLTIPSGVTYRIEGTWSASTPPSRRERIASWFQRVRSWVADKLLAEIV